MKKKFEKKVFNTKKILRKTKTQNIILMLFIRRISSEKYEKNKQQNNTIKYKLIRNETIR